ncbi:hypothetical protein ABZ471_34020 [Streptomyces sp. NPDC005728]|uniref:hypothetical protein n=1 Tax=Streptomyces sp. NPDC005728 TaxID=3157054 RepID=UPI0033E307D7
MSAVPADAAAAGTAPPDPGELIARQGTAAPALVDGIREPAPAATSPAGAAHAYLATKKDRYRIADPDRDLKPAGTDTSGGRETVRLRQTYHGVPVLGGEYVVRMDKKDGRRIVTGTSGKYFTGLRTGTTAEVDDALAVERAVDAVRNDLGARGPSAGEEDASSLTGTSHGLVVLPTGTGVLTRHVTVRGQDPAHGEPVLREVYIDAQAGYPVLRYSSVQTFGTALNISDLTVSGQAVTMVARTPLAELNNASLSKLWQFAPEHKGDGPRRSRVSCNRGEQLAAAAAAGTQVIWLDATTGVSDVVTRTRPAGTCG